MIHRPVDESGDILPVRSSADLLRGSRAAAQLVRERLALYTGGWWENPAWGSELPEMLAESRLTEADGEAKKEAEHLDALREWWNALPVAETSVKAPFSR